MAGLYYCLNFYFHVSDDAKLNRLKILLENHVYPIPVSSTGKKNFWEIFLNLESQ